jgi:hypothetical protein
MTRVRVGAWENRQQQKKKQIPPLRCGMTNKRGNDKEDKQPQRRNAGILRRAQE